MKKLNLFVFATTLALAACGQHEAAPTAAAIDVAEKYCAKNFKPYNVIADACIAEIDKGKRGANCATFAQVDAILGKQVAARGVKECSPPEFRFGPNASKN